LDEIRDEFEDKSKVKNGARKCDSENLSSKKASVLFMVLHVEIVLARQMG